MKGNARFRECRVQCAFGECLAGFLCDDERHHRLVLCQDQVYEIALVHRAAMGDDDLVIPGHFSVYQGNQPGVLGPERARHLFEGKPLPVHAMVHGACDMVAYAHCKDLLVGFGNDRRRAEVPHAEPHPAGKDKKHGCSHGQSPV